MRRCPNPLKDAEGHSSQGGNLIFLKLISTFSTTSFCLQVSKTQLDRAETYFFPPKNQITQITCKTICSSINLSLVGVQNIYLLIGFSCPNFFIDKAQCLYLSYSTHKQCKSNRYYII
jgi:hypothetical protein